MYSGNVNKPTVSSSLPKIIFMGRRKSGKSSIRNVVFQKVSPHETLFIEQTAEPVIHEYPSLPPSQIDQSLLRCQIIEIPSNFDLKSDKNFNVQNLFSLHQPTCLVYVVDTQGEDSSNADLLIRTLDEISLVKTGDFNNLYIEVLLHKTDSDGYAQTSLNNDNEAFLEFKRTVSVSLPTFKSSITYHSTSIYDHSILDVFANILQHLLPNKEMLESLLDSFSSSSSVDRCYLIDITSKLVLCQSTAKPDPSIHELCGDMVDVVVDVCCIYGIPKENDPEDIDEDCISSTITLKNGLVLRSVQMNTCLILITLTNSNISQNNPIQPNLINYNVTCLKQALYRVFNVYTFGNITSLKDMNRSQSKGLSASSLLSMMGSTPNLNLAPSSSSNSTSIPMGGLFSTSNKSSGSGGEIYGIDYMGSMAVGLPVDHVQQLASALLDSQGTSLSNYNVGSVAAYGQYVEKLNQLQKR